MKHSCTVTFLQFPSGNGISFPICCSPESHTSFLGTSLVEVLGRDVQDSSCEISVCKMNTRERVRQSAIDEARHYTRMVFLRGEFQHLQPVRALHSSPWKLQEQLEESTERWNNCSTREANIVQTARPVLPCTWHSSLQSFDSTRVWHSPFLTLSPATMDPAAKKGKGRQDSANRWRESTSHH